MAGNIEYIEAFVESNGDSIEVMVDRKSKRIILEVGEYVDFYDGEYVTVEFTPQTIEALAQCLLKLSKELQEDTK